MRQSPLLLDSIFYPVSRVSANPAAPNGEMGEVEIAANILFAETRKFYVNINVEWGKPESSPYSIHCNAHAICRIAKEIQTTRAELERMAFNGAAILLSAAREHIAQITARAPYGEVFLPAIILESTDFKLAFEDSVADTLSTKAPEPESRNTTPATRSPTRSPKKK